MRAAAAAAAAGLRHHTCALEGRRAARWRLEPAGHLTYHRCALVCAPVAGAGKLEKAPRRPQLTERHEESQKLTKAINAENELHFAGVAEGAGGKMGVVKAPSKEEAASQRHRPGRPGGSRPHGASQK